MRQELSHWDELYNRLVPCHVNPVLLCHVTNQPEGCVNCRKKRTQVCADLRREKE